MIIKETDDIAKYIIIVNQSGDVIRFVKEFDTETKKALIYAKIIHKNNKIRTAVCGDYFAFLGKGEEDRDVVTFECHLLGYKAIDRRTNEEIK